MERVWEKINLFCGAGELEFISIQTPSSLSPFRNIYGYQFGFDDNESNHVIVVERRNRFILGYLRVRLSVSGHPVVAGKNYDVFTIERLGFSCLEILEVQIHSEAWNRPFFLQSLGECFLIAIEDIGCEVALIHLYEKPEDIPLALWTLVNFPLKSPIIFCEPKDKKDVYKIEDKFIGSEFAKKNVFSREFDNLTKMGFELWSEPRVNDLTKEISFFLGVISPSFSQQLRPFSLHDEFRRGRSDAIN